MVPGGIIAWINVSRSNDVADVTPRELYAFDATCLKPSASGNAGFPFTSTLLIVQSLLNDKNP